MLSRPAPGKRIILQSQVVYGCNMSSTRNIPHSGRVLERFHLSEGFWKQKTAGRNTAKVEKGSFHIFRTDPCMFPCLSITDPVQGKTLKGSALHSQESATDLCDGTPEASHWALWGGTDWYSVQFSKLSYGREGSREGKGTDQSTLIISIQQK